MMAKVEQVWSAIRRLDRWIQQNGWAGYDPFDVKGSPIFLSLQGNSSSFPYGWKTIARVLVRLRAGDSLFRLEERRPRLARVLFRLKKTINAKGMGLFAKGYLGLYELTRDEHFRNRAIDCLRWLRANPSPGFSGLCWGYPFDWQSKIFIPRGTPSAVVSAVVGDGFWKAYRILGNSDYLEVCDSICRFLVNDLNRDEMDPQCLCFSYTPLDDFHVHNANLFTAEFLIRIGQEVGKGEYIGLGRRAATYALREQNEDGSIYYWGRVQDHYAPRQVDHYHTGFKIRALYALWKLTHDPLYDQALKRLYRFYLGNLLVNAEGLVIPKMAPTGLYPIDIHSCAEAILCNATLAEEFEEADALLQGLCAWVIEKMQNPNGSFSYMVRWEEGRERIETMPYIRWGQAWMLASLAKRLTV